MRTEENVRAAILLLAKSLVDQYQWPQALAEAAAETFATMQVKRPEELKRYAQMPYLQKKELWSYYAMGFNQGWTYGKLDTN